MQLETALVCTVAHVRGVLEVASFAHVVVGLTLVELVSWDVYSQRINVVWLRLMRHMVLTRLGHLPI